MSTEECIKCHQVKEIEVYFLKTKGELAPVCEACWKKVADNYDWNGKRFVKHKDEVIT